MPDKNYINGIIIKGSKFGLNCSIKVDEFIEQLKAIENKGWANITIKERKTASDKGVTHYVEENSWKPKDRVEYEDSGNNDDSGLPF